MSDEYTHPGKSDENLVLPEALVRSLVKKCRDSTEAYVRSLFGPLVDQFDEDLANLIDKTDEEEKRRRYTEAKIRISEERSQLSEQLDLLYTKRLSYVLNPTAAGEEGGEGSVLDGLSLVDDAQLEESLVVEQITASVFESYSDELYALEQRLGLLLPELRMDEGKIPFGSAPVTNAFEELLEPMGFGVRVKLVLYRSLERVLISTIGDHFTALNEILASAGVLPEIKRTAKNSESRQLVTKRQGEGQRQQEVVRQDDGLGDVVGDGGGIPAGSIVMPPHAFHGLQQLAGLFGDGASLDPEKLATLQATPVTPQLVEALSGLQISDELLEVSGEISGEELKARIKAQLSERDGAPSEGVSQLDDETIDVITMIFDDLMDDALLPDFIKALIGRLQIPVLKVAILDRVFFSEKEHPARQLLNELTIAGQTASREEDDEESANQVYQKIETIVMQLIREFQGDLAIFEQCLADLRQFMGQQEAEFERARQKISDVAQKSSFEAKTKKNIAEEIASRLLNRNVPEDVKRFLMETWRQVLLTIMLNEGEQSEALKRAEQVCEDLIWSVGPLQGAEAKKKLLLVVPLILDAMKEGLDLISFSDEQMQEVMQMIERYHIANIKGERVVEKNQPELSEPSEPVVKDEIDQLLQDLEDDLGLPESERLGSEALSLSAPDSNGSGEYEKMLQAMGCAPAEDDGPQIDDKYSILVHTLEEGTWIELFDDEGEKRRAKLAWKGDEFTKYAFVNWRYKVIAERSFYSLADEFRQGNAAIIEDLPLFDRAFDTVFGRIMKMAG